MLMKLHMYLQSWYAGMLTLFLILLLFRFSLNGAQNMDKKERILSDNPDESYFKWWRKTLPKCAQIRARAYPPTNLYLLRDSRLIASIYGYPTQDNCCDEAAIRILKFNNPHIRKDVLKCVPFSELILLDESKIRYAARVTHFQSERVEFPDEYFFHHELRVLDLVAQDLENKDIAKRLDLSLKRVSNYYSQAKLGLAGQEYHREHVIAKARERGLI